MASGIIAEMEMDLQTQAFAIRKENFCDDVSFFVPGLKRYQTSEIQQNTPKSFRSVSLTGAGCALKCDHCDSKILESMIPLNHQEGIFNLCKRLKESGTENILLSGGSKPTGEVPFLKHMDDIARIKKDLGVQLMVHTGVVTEEISRGLKEAKVDGVMLDIIGANETIRDVYHLDLTVEDFDHSLDVLHKHGHSVRPHIILGLHYGKILGEYTALEMIKKYPVHSLILVILIPLSGTAMEGIPLTDPLEIRKFFQHSRIEMPKTPIMVGCARPLGDHKIAVDHAAIDSGLNGIAYPAEGIIEYAQSKGLTPNFIEKSCSCGS